MVFHYYPNPPLVQCPFEPLSSAHTLQDCKQAEEANIKWDIGLEKQTTCSQKLQHILSKCRLQQKLGEILLKQREKQY